MKKILLVEPKKLKFYVILASWIILLFILNINHVNQQIIYSKCFVGISQNIIDGKGYTFNNINYYPSFYPIWGYTFFVLPDTLIKANGALVIIFQMILCFIGIIYFYKIFNFETKYFHLLFFIPFISVLSVKWPESIAAFLLLPYIYYNLLYYKTNKIKFIFISGLILGILVNFRTENLFLPLIQIIILLIFTFKKYLKQNIILNLSVFLIAILCLMPWALRIYHYKNELKFTATNSGMVLYASFGNLPNNPWHIYASENSTKEFLAKKGIFDAYTFESDSMVTNECIRLIKKYPGDFIKKCIYNIFLSISGGVYTGEFANILINPERRLELNDSLLKKGSQYNQLKALFKLKLKESLPIFFEKVIQGIFIPIFFLLSVSFGFTLFFFRKKELNLLIGIISSVLISKYAIVILLLYEYRQMNGIFIFLFGLFFITLPFYKQLFLKLIRYNSLK